LSHRNVRLEDSLEASNDVSNIIKKGFTKQCIECIETMDQPEHFVCALALIRTINRAALICSVWKGTLGEVRASLNTVLAVRINCNFSDSKRTLSGRPICNWSLSFIVIPEPAQKFRHRDHARSAEIVVGEVSVDNLNHTW